MVGSSWSETDSPSPEVATSSAPVTSCWTPRSLDLVLLLETVPSSVRLDVQSVFSFTEYR